MFFKHGRTTILFKMIFLLEEEASPGFADRDIVIHPHGHPCEQISILSTNCDPAYRETSDCKSLHSNYAAVLQLLIGYLINIQCHLPWRQTVPAVLGGCMLRQKAHALTRYDIIRKITDGAVPWIDGPSQ